LSDILTRRANHQYIHTVIACDKREAFAQGSLLVRRSLPSGEGGCDEAIDVAAQRKMDCFAEPVIGRAFARPVGSQ
jgi:hypothetical protein